MVQQNGFERHNEYEGKVQTAALFLCIPHVSGPKAIGQLAAQLFLGQLCVNTLKLNMTDSNLALFSLFQFRVRNNKKNSVSVQVLVQESTESINKIKWQNRKLKD